jgi:tRNA 2-thiouridine synthesizing protein A
VADAKQVIDVDARGLLCPLPILRLAKSLDSSPGWAAATLVATDPDARSDVEAFCEERRLTLRGVRRRGNEWTFEIARGPETD